MVHQIINPTEIDAYAKNLHDIIGDGIVREVVLREFQTSSKPRETHAELRLILSNGTIVTVNDKVSSYPVIKNVVGSRITSVNTWKHDDGYWGITLNKGKRAIIQIDGKIHPSEGIEIAKK